MPAELADTLVSTEADRLLQAEALVRGFCGWHIAPSRTETLTVARPRSYTIGLPSLHVTAVASVTSDGTALLTTDYAWSEAGVLTGITDWWRGDSVVVAFTHGYPLPPAEVTAIVQAVAQRAVQNPGSLTRQQIGPFSDTYSTTGQGEVANMALLASEKATLRRYRIPVVG